MVWLVLAFLYLPGVVLFSQDLRTIEIVDRVGGAPILFAQLVAGSKVIATTNELGKAQIPCKSIPIQFQVLAFGKAKQIVIPPIGNCEKVVRLTLNLSYDLELVTVKAKVSANTSTQVHHPEELVNSPMLLGQPDLLRGLALKSGVSHGQEGSASLYIRGGTPDQTLIMLDDAPVYNSNHLGGFMSVFQDDAVNSVTLYKTTPPIGYGNRLSGLVDVRLRTGSAEKWRGKFGMGLVSTNGYLEGPLVKDKTTIVAGTRLGHLGLINIGRRTKSEEDYFDLRMRDGLIKISHVFSPRQRLYVSAYHSFDENSISENVNNLFNSGNIIDRRYSKLSTNYGNNTVSLRHYFALSSKLQLISIAYLSKYNTRFTDIRRSYRSEELVATTQQDVSSRLDEMSATNQLTISGERLITTFGIAATRKSADPFNIAIDSLPIGDDSDSGQSDMLTGFVGSKFQAADKLALEAGFRGSRYRNGDYHTFLPELRARVDYDASKNWKLSIGGNFSSQDLHLIGGSRLGQSFDTYALADSSMIPQRGWQFDFGASGLLNELGQIAIGIYYRKMSNIKFLQTSRFSADAAIDILAERTNNRGKGFSRGIEVEYAITRARYTLNIAYTLSQTRHRFAGLNHGNPFPFRYDRPHDLAINLSYNLNRGYKIGGSFILQSGIVVTSPTAQIPASNHFLPIDVVPSVNNVRLPTYHRMDIFMSKTWVGKKHNTNELKLSVYNLYNQVNPTYYSAYAVYVGDDNYQVVTTKVGQFGFLPSIYYSHDFGYH